jgi:SAM-dependent methyltransferase
VTKKTMPESLNRNDPETVRERVRQGYAEIARAPAPSGGKLAAGSCGCGPRARSCCGATAPTADTLAQSVGYNEAELATLPDGANMGLSCGNPTALAALKAGEVVVDLGAGGGFDCFLAGPRVGPTGRVIGVDMTPDMVTKARRNVAAYRQRSGLDNVEFRLGEIEHLPVADRSVDVVISNCVINLSPDKPQVWREIARVLRPGGRVAVSDLALLRPLPAEIRELVAAWVGCVAGAVLVPETEAYARDAGLVDIRLERKPEYAAALTSFEDPLYQKIAAALPAGTRPSDFVTSLNVTARKPG